MEYNNNNQLNTMTDIERTDKFNTYITPHYELITWCVDRYYSSSDRATSDRRDDMIQECLINLHRYIHTYDPAKSIKTWIHVACKRHIADVKGKVNNNTGAVCSYGDRPDDISELNSTGISDDIITLLDIPVNHITAYNVPEEDFLKHCSDRVRTAVNALQEANRRLFMGVVLGYSLEEVGSELLEEGLLINTLPDNLMLQYWFAIKSLRNQLKHK